MSQFKKRFFGKWVLSGEHSVLRYGPALIYPLPLYYMDFYYKKSDNPLQIERKGTHRLGLDFSVTPLLDKALKLVHKKREDLKGSLSIEGWIPFGAGLGASAALCAGTASLFLHKTWISKQQLKEFAISLEDFFHGKSSGMDVTAALEKKAILYQKGQPLKYLSKFKSKPNLFLSYCGGRASTSVTVSKVRKFFDKNWDQAEQTDKNMAHSVELCLLALKEKDKAQCNKLLTQALTLGENCFDQWKLISYDLERHIDYLKKQGAGAVKPTGSGLGGHVISLWNKKPPLDVRKKLIHLNV